MGWGLFFGQGGDGHGWTPNSTDSSFAWNAYASNQVKELYFSNEDNRSSIPDGQSSVSENWQLAHGPSPVPEPQTYVLMFLGLACISRVKIRRQRAARWLRSRFGSGIRAGPQCAARNTGTHQPHCAVGSSGRLISLITPGDPLAM